MQYNLLKIASQSAADTTQYDDTGRVEKDDVSLSERLIEYIEAERAEAEKQKAEKAELERMIERLQATRARLARRQKNRRLGMKRVRTKRLFKKRTNRTSRHWEKGNLFGL